MTMIDARSVIGNVLCRGGQDGRRRAQRARFVDGRATAGFAAAW